MSKKHIRQHNAITEARYEMSALEKDIFYMLLAQVREDDAFGKEYVIHLNKLEEHIGKISAEELGKAEDNLLSRVYVIPKDGGELYVSLMTVVRYNDLERTLRIKISQKLLPYLIKLKAHYTEYQLDMALRLKSKYAKRMYEMLSQHKEVGLFAISLRDFKYRLYLLNKRGEEKYEAWAMFKKHILDVAQKELAEHTDIRFTYTAKKTGRKYTHLEFQIAVDESTAN